MCVGCERLSGHNRNGMKIDSNFSEHTKKKGNTRKQTRPVKVQTIFPKKIVLIRMIGFFLVFESPFVILFLCNRLSEDGTLIIIGNEKK